MSRWDDMIQRHRRSMLAALMGLALLASTGVAAWLVASRDRAVGPAVQVLQHIAQRGLPALWGDEKVTRWYIKRAPDGQPLGWWMLRRMPVAGGYVGATVQYEGPLLARATWRVDNDARGARYGGEIFRLVMGPSARRPVPQREMTTTILLQDGRIEVHRADPRGTYTAAAAAPQNYIPEGLSELAFFLAAAKDRRARFAMIIDQAAIAPDGGLAFAQADVAPDGLRRVRAAVRSGLGQDQETLQFDATGDLVRKEAGPSGAWYEPATFEAVQRIFPYAALFAGPEEEGRD